MSKEMERLLRGSTNANVMKQSRAIADYKYSKDKIKKICRSLSYDSYGFKPQKVVEIIAAYINNGRKLKRILYSEISNYIFALEYNEIATFSSNIGTLRDFALKSEDTMQEDYFERNMLNIQYSFDSTIKVNIYDDLLINFSEIADLPNIYKKGKACVPIHMPFLNSQTYPINTFFPSNAKPYFLIRSAGIPFACKDSA